MYSFVVVFANSRVAVLRHPSETVVNSIVWFGVKVDAAASII